MDKKSKEQALKMTDNTTQPIREVEGSLELQFVEMGAIRTPPQRGRSKHLSPVALVTRDPSEIRVSSDQLTSRILLGLLDQSDVAIVVVRDYRNEHADLPGLTLANGQDVLVQTVAAANPRTIIVVASGGPVLMPWLSQVPAVLESWYGGQEQGNALADVLFGDVNPAGKLPVTFPLGTPRRTTGR
jgi:Glycosyl hydrolase family 3 C-terminal domain